MGRKRTLTVAAIADMAASRLRQEWEHHYGFPAPSLSVDLLRLGLAFYLQERREGKLDRSVLAQLRPARSTGSGRAGTPLRKLTPGTKLVRDWRGVGHTVTVLEKGFAYDGRQWASLSAVASHITGVHWSGPRFFGLGVKSA